MSATQQPKPSSLSEDLIRTYLHEIGRVPLLTHEQEIVLGKRVQRMMSLLAEQEKLENKLGLKPTLTQWAKAVDLTTDELNQVLRQGRQAKKKMIEANLRLVVSVAKKYLKRNMEFLDLIQEGSLGLERGVEKFTPSRGYRFSTYAYWWIRQAITRAIYQQSRTIRLPIHITEKNNKIKKTQRELSQKLGRIATISEVADELELKPEVIRQCLKANRQPLSLNLLVGEEQETELSEIIEDELTTSPGDYATFDLMRQDVRDLLQELKPKEREVLSLRFGLEDGEEWSLAKIGQKLNLSRERIRQLESRAIARLRYKQPHALREYLAV